MGNSLSTKQKYGIGFGVSASILVVVAVVLAVVLTRPTTGDLPTLTPTPTITSTVIPVQNFFQLKTSDGKCVTFAKLETPHILNIGDCSDLGLWVSDSSSPSVTFLHPEYQYCIISALISNNNFPVLGGTTGCTGVILTADNKIQSPASNLCINLVNNSFLWRDCSTAYIFVVNNVSQKVARKSLVHS